MWGSSGRPSVVLSDNNNKSEVFISHYLTVHCDQVSYYTLNSCFVYISLAVPLFLGSSSAKRQTSEWKKLPRKKLHACRVRVQTCGESLLSPIFAREFFSICLFSVSLDELKEKRAWSWITVS